MTTNESVIDLKREVTPETAEAVERLKRERNAVLLVHNYQIAEVQDLADYLGDSLGLSQQAAATDADVIVFCGVHFMAQTAKIVCPDKTVLMPDPGAGCPMADMITAEALIEFKAEHPGVPVVTYVNSTAEVKAESDICCTSANSVRIVQSLDTDRVIFVPDHFLGTWTQEQLPDVEFILWGGFCPTHAKMTAEMVEQARAEHPDAVFICHPECRPEVTSIADAVLSTGGMVRFAAETDAREIIIGTEEGMAYRLKRENPDKEFHVLPGAVCPNMKKTTADKVLASLENMQFEIEVEPEIAERARRAVERMLAVG
ncbi:MAG: quinolinate synthase NadA [Armatimonadetes bacterium]|nr:quinolinate synthase NadA [Armatimonadota bacterium]